MTDTEEVLYFHNTPDDGYTINLGSNPFFQTATAQRQHYIDNLLAEISNIAYNSCSVTIPFGFHYDLGDVLQFPNGQGSSTNKFCVIGYSWTYYGDSKITSIAGVKASKSKSDKNIQGIVSTAGKNEFTSYELKNLSAISIGDGDEERLLLARIASNKSTKAQIHIEVNLESVATNGSTALTTFDELKNLATKAIVTYLINSEEDTTIYPTETYVDGKHIMHLMYILPLVQNSLTIFEVYLRSIDGSISIGQGDVWLYASGAGLVGDGKWDGFITIQEDVSDWNLIELTFESASDTVSADTQTPIAITNSDTATNWNLIELTFSSATDSIYITENEISSRRILEDGSIRMTEEDSVRYTEGD